MPLNRFAAATLSLSAAIVMTAASAGVASAATAGKPKHHPKPKPVAQVPGKKLASALLPASTFGGDYSAAGEQDTGWSLWSSHVSKSLSGLGCSTFILDDFLTGYGETAEAGEGIGPKGTPSAGDTLVVGLQNISQFASKAAAGAYFGQDMARYKSCKSETVTDPGDQNSGPTTVTITLQNVSKTSVAKNQAFSFVETADITDSSGTDITSYITGLVVNAGTNVYSVTEWNINNNAVPGWMLASMITKAQKLYKH